MESGYFITLLICSELDCSKDGSSLFSSLPSVGSSSTVSVEFGGFSSSFV